MRAFRRRVLRIGTLAAACSAVLLSGSARPAAAADPWLFVNDIHLDLHSTDRAPVGSPHDTNLPLLTSAIAAMRRASPHPPVVVMAGDFLSHYFQRGDAVPTMQILARRFNAAFPDAQFVLALGNEDSACGDYKIGRNAPFLRAVVRVWEPLVDRHGAAPDFARTFARDGFYTARLPLHGVRAVVIDDAYFSPFYRNACGRGDPTPEALAELDRALAPGGTERRWVLAHIPIGIDVASSLHRTKHLAVVPFLRPDPRETLITLLADPRRRVEAVISGHVHRFAYRVITQGKGAVPLLISPAISPIFWNNPAFLTADIALDGRILNLDEHADIDGTWRAVGGLSDLGIASFTAPALLDAQRRLEHSPALRGRFAALYDARTNWHEITEQNWRPYWCSANHLTATSFRACLNEGGFSVLTTLGVAVVGVAAGGAALVAAGVIALVLRWSRRRAAAR